MREDTKNFWVRHWKECLTGKGVVGNTDTRTYLNDYMDLDERSYVEGWKLVGNEALLIAQEVLDERV